MQGMPMEPPYDPIVNPLFGQSSPYRDSPASQLPAAFGLLQATLRLVFLSATNRHSAAGPLDALTVGSSDRSTIMRIGVSVSRRDLEK